MKRKLVWRRAEPGLWVSEPMGPIVCSSGFRRWHIYTDILQALRNDTIVFFGTLVRAKAFAETLWARSGKQ